MSDNTITTEMLAQVTVGGKYSPENKYENFFDKIIENIDDINKAIDDLEETSENHADKFETLRSVTEEMVNTLRIHNDSLIKMEKFIENSMKMQESDVKLHKLHDKRISSNANMILFAMAMNIMSLLYYSGDLAKILGFFKGVASLIVSML